jgi:DDE superfamily endonuclease
VSWLGHLAKSVWVVADGAYAKAPFLKPMRTLAVTVVSRLRKDSALWTVPGPRAPHRRGPHRIYGEQRIDLAKRGGQRRGWVTGTFDLYGKATEKKYKTFVATWRPAGGAIRVVLVDEPTGWVAFFCTDPTATVADVLTSVAGRFSLEITFRDLKDVVGAGQQQVRLVRASVGAFHVCLWTFTMTEAWTWNRDEQGLVEHRSASPWDDETRRPGHADKRRAWRRELLGNEIRAALRVGATERELQSAAERLLNLAA